MLSLWRGEDGQIYAFGTETGDFLRLTDITESWKARFGDLLRARQLLQPRPPEEPPRDDPGDLRRPQGAVARRGSTASSTSTTTRPPRGSAVELSDDPHHVLKHVLVRGLRKNKGTSGDQPSLRAGLEFAGEQRAGDPLPPRHRRAAGLAEPRRRRAAGRAPAWSTATAPQDIYAAREVVGAAFRGPHLRRTRRRALTDRRRWTTT